MRVCRWAGCPFFGLEDGTVAALLYMILYYSGLRAPTILFLFKGCIGIMVNPCTHPHTRAARDEGWAGPYYSEGKGSFFLRTWRW